MMDRVSLLWENLKNKTASRRLSLHEAPGKQIRTAQTIHDDSRAIEEANFDVNDTDILSLLRRKDTASRQKGLNQLKATLIRAECLQQSDFDLLSDAARELVVCFSEAAESFRRDAGMFLKRLIGLRGFRTNQLLQYLMPVLQEKLVRNCSQRRYLEASEEIRLLCFEIVQSIAESLQADIEPFMDIVYSLLSEGCCESYHKIQFLCCSSIQTLCDIFGTRMARVAKELVAVVGPLALHRHSRVRIAAIQTLTKLIHCGAHEMILELIAFQNPNVIPLKEFFEFCPHRNFLGSLATDTSASVRIAFLDMIKSWLMILPERVDYVSRLLPYLLSTLVDRLPAIRYKGYQVLKDVGALYEREHDEDVAEQVLYLADCSQTALWKCFTQLHETNSEEGMGSSLLDPFTARPSLGVRLLVQHNVSFFLGAILRELESPDDAIVVKSLQLLRVVLLLVEDGIIDHLSEIFESLIRLIAEKTVLTKEGEKSLRQVALLFRVIVDTSSSYSLCDLQNEWFMHQGKGNLAISVFTQSLNHKK